MKLEAQVELSHMRSYVGLYCKSNNPAKRRVVRFKFQKQSALKFVDRTILHKHGYNTPQLAAELFPKLALGFIPVIAVFL
jgi:tRNA1(Val) A37 N6-methylase TrmN6